MSTPRVDLVGLRSKLAAEAWDQAVPPQGRLSATMLLLAPTEDGDATLTLTRRQPFLSSHPGQISFPGGRIDEGETPVEAALRETEEEIGLDRSAVDVIGNLPPFYIAPSRYWMVPFVGLWDGSQPLKASESEVAEILTVRLVGDLSDPAKLRSVRLTVTGRIWAWLLGPERLLWGATGYVTALLLDLAVPGWHGGNTPSQLPEDRQVVPWETPERFGLVPRASETRPRLKGVPTTGRIAPVSSQVFADGVVAAIASLAVRPEGPVVILAGPGRTGDIGRRVAEILSARAADHGVVLIDRDEIADRDDLEALLVSAGVIVDALVGRGFKPPLRGGAALVQQLLSRTAAPIIAVDLPSGIHPTGGVVTATVSADVTVAPAPLEEGHRAGAFVGDLYGVTTDGKLTRVEGDPAAWAE